MKWKLSADGKSIEIDDKGFPISLVEKEGKEEEVGIDVAHLFDKIPTLQAEAKGHREKLQALEKLHKPFVDLDAAKVKSALELTANLDAKKLVDAGEIENLKNQFIENHAAQLKETKGAYESQIEELQGIANLKDTQIFNLMVSEQFAKSDYFSGKNPLTTLPPDVALAYFRDNFKVEAQDGTSSLNVVGYYDGAGKDKIYSKSRAGDVADFSEALTAIIDRSPHKKSIMRASSGGGENQKPNTGVNGATLTISREQARDPNAYQQAKAQAQEKGLTLVMSDA